jgi:4-hydroxy-3-methylbut-2-enyl diphosphate reductase
VRAVEIVEQALLLYGAPIYVLHQIVHNQQVIQDLEARGVIFTEDMKSIPPRTVTVLSAHGVSDAVMETAQAQDLEIIDATCPLVTKVHLQAKRYSKSGHEVVIIGHRGHVEVEGTYGRVRGTVHVVGTVEDVQALVVSDPKQVSYVTQTTLSLDDTRSIVQALKDRFPEVKGPELSDICYATQNRQNAVRSLAERVDVILVVGARNSSNSARLQEVGEMSGVDAYLIQDANEISPDWFANSSAIGVTAGASTPEILVQGVLDRLRALGVSSIEEMEGVSEDITFKLPASLLREQKPL